MQLESAGACFPLYPSCSPPPSWRAVPSGWGDAISVLVLLGGIATCALHLHRRARAGASRRLQDEIGLAAGLVAAAYVVVAAAGAAIFPIVYLLVALLVSGL